MKDRIYMGVDKDPKGAMNTTGNIFRDAQVFGLIPETETGAGWPVSRVNVLYDQVSLEWEKYGLLVSNLPPELRDRHKRIYDKAIANALAMGWDPEQDYSD